MADQRDGGIAWTDESWNPVRGCSRVSEGCRNCYAERIAERFCDGPHYEDVPYGQVVVQGQPFHTFAERGKGWTRKVALLPEMLADPLRWQRPRRVFVNSMSDLFHEALSDEDIDAVLAVMLVAPKHTFQVLTKRAARMREYFAAPGLYDRVLRAAGPLRVTFPKTMGVGISNPGVRLPPWIWLGVSVEDQQRADERIPHLLATPAAVRWVSYEPALGPVDFTLHGSRIPGWDEDWKYNTLTGQEWARPSEDEPESRSPHLDWIVVGGESGPGARPFDLAWARSTIRQCREAGVPAFFKQAGSQPLDTAPGRNGWPEHVRFERHEPDGCPHIARVILRDRKGGDPAEWPEDLRRREFPNVQR